MKIQRYINLYNEMSRELYHQPGDLDLYKRGVTQSLELLIKELAKEQDMGLCWGSYGVSVDDRLKPSKK